jgi:hypothetical protein
MGMMDVIGKVGGVGKIMELASDPLKAGALVATSMPGATHTLGRMKLYQEIAARAAFLSAQAANILTQALLNKSDVPVAAIEAMSRTELDLLMYARLLNMYPKTAEDMNLGKLAEAFGISSGNDGEAKDAGNKENPSNGV